MPGPDIQAINAKILPLNKALVAARDVLTKVRGMLDIGASNQQGSGPAQRDCVGRARKFTAPHLQFKGSFFWSVGDIREIADRATMSRCGNCGENAAIAFIQCVDGKIEPLDYMECAGPDDDHAFLVIGRREGSDPSRYNATSWGPDAVVCDPWMNKVYPCSEMGIHLASQTDSFIYRSKCRYRTVGGLVPI
jgi:hypothetical protein